MQKRTRNLIVGLVLAVTLGAFIAKNVRHQPQSESHQVILVTHDSFVMSKADIRDFEKSSGLTLSIVKAGDAGSLTNRLILTKDKPIGDAVFGIDNTFAGLAASNGIISGKLTPTDFGDVCFNYDKAWFTSHHVPAPTSISDLTSSLYRGLTVVENPNTSSTGLSFLAATVDKFGEHGWSTYWSALKSNNLKVDDGWESAYYTDFSGSSGKGNFPIVLSYASSPADEIDSNGVSRTASIMDGCFRQTEFSGVLAKAKNPRNAEVLVRYLLATRFQTTIPSGMYMYPVNKEAPLPTSWLTNTHIATQTFGDSLDINAHRKTWLTTWTALFE